MNRNEWETLHHTIRADTRAFRSIYGGWPCFVRRFHNSGRRWSLERSIDRASPRGKSLIWAALADHPRQLRAQRINDAATFRRAGDLRDARRLIAVIRANA